MLGGRPCCRLRSSLHFFTGSGDAPKRSRRPDLLLLKSINQRDDLQERKKKVVSILPLNSMTISKYLTACVFVLIQLFGLCNTYVCDHPRTSFFKRSTAELANAHYSW